VSTFKVTVERLVIEPHPDADLLELAQVGLYRAVVPKDVYKTGEWGVYIPEQAILPDKLIEELGLVGKLAGKEKNRVKAVRLRGALSQGIVCRPAALSADGEETWDWSDEDASDPGIDYSGLLGITKWVPEIPACMSGAVIPAPDLVRWPDIENLKRYPDIFKAGESVVATEKIHGCLHGSVRVLMPDGTNRRIADLVKEEYRGDVLGMNEHGQVVETPVLATFDNGKTTDWLRVGMSRRGIGRGSSSGAVTLTPNHRVYSPNHPRSDEEGFVVAANLGTGDEVWLHRTEVTLVPLAEQVLIGKMLGDGSLSQGAVHWSHKAEHRDYVAWTAQMLGSELCDGVIDERFTSGYGTPMARCKTRASVHIREMFADWVIAPPHGNQIPASAADRIGPIALAFWYMDDGSLMHHPDQEDRVSIATCAFDEPSVDNLVKALERFGIVAVKYVSSGWRLRLNSEAAERLFLLIAPYVPEVMQYKLPERYRGAAAGFPRTFGAFKPAVRPQLVTSVSPVVNGTAGDQSGVVSPRGSSKYDLQTGVGSYFANGMLVHNSACLVTYVTKSDQLLVSSKGFGDKNLALERDENNLYWRAVLQFELDAKLSTIAETYDASSVALFGEVYGQGVQDLGYGKAASRNETLGFVAFDIVVNGSDGKVWLSPRHVATLTAKLGIPAAPILYEGPFDIEKLTEVASGPTVLGGGAHIREGIVIRPKYHMISTITGGRKIAKLVSDAYLMRKNATEFE
jgi:hypothetical protein